MNSVRITTSPRPKISSPKSNLVVLGNRLIDTILGREVIQENTMPNHYPIKNQAIISIISGPQK